MPSILRSSLSFDESDAVEIPDAEFKPVEVEILPELVENNQPEKESFVVQGFDMTDYSPEQREQVAKFLNAKVQQLTEAYKSEAQAELERAKAEADKKAEEILKNAEERRQEIIKHAQIQSSEICERARQQGTKAGQQEKISDIENAISELETTVSQMKLLQNERFDEFSEQLKWLACDVASRLVYKKIDEDDLYLKELVVAAIKEAKEAEWISVSLSDKLGVLTSKLRAELSDSDMDVEFENVNVADVGDVVVNGSDRKVVASVREQLENIRKYFETFDEFYVQ